MKQSTKTKTEIFNMRIDIDTKKKLEELAKKGEFKNNSSAVIRSLIHSAYSKKVL